MKCQVPKELKRKREEKQKSRKNKKQKKNERRMSCGKRRNNSINQHKWPKTTKASNTRKLHPRTITRSNVVTINTHQSRRANLRYENRGIQPWSNIKRRRSRERRRSTNELETEHAS